MTASDAPQLRDTATGFAVSGVVDYDNAETLMHGGGRLIEAANDSVEIDISAVQAGAGSLQVAVMLTWLRRAANADVAIRFVGVSQGVRRIVDVSGLTDTLPLDADSTEHDG